MAEKSAEEGDYKEPEAETRPADSDYQEAARSTADYGEYHKPQKKKRDPKWRKLGIWLLIVVLIAGLAAGGYWFIKSRKSSNKPAESSQAAKSAAPAQTITTETKHYDSDSFKLSFDYPGNWTATDDNPDEIKVLSPDLKLKGTDGADVTGQILFRIRAKGQKLPRLDSGDAVAILDSEKIAYTQPTEVQRASTYISFLRYADNTEGLDAIYITGDLGYAKDQNVPEADIQKVDPIISIEFYLCPDSGCVEVSGVSGIGVETWEDESVSTPLTSMLESLVIN
jgi:hypothetical protein